MLQLWVRLLDRPRRREMAGLRHGVGVVTALAGFERGLGSGRAVTERVCGATRGYRV
jgi:hypothetical protein